MCFIVNGFIPLLFHFFLMKQIKLARNCASSPEQTEQQSQSGKNILAEILLALGDYIISKGQFSLI